MHGEVFQLNSVGDRRRSAPASAPSSGCASSNADGEVVGAPFGPFTAADDGTVDATHPGRGDRRRCSPGRDDGLPRDASGSRRSALGFEDDGPLGSGFWAAPDGEPAGSAAVAAVPDEPVLENSFVSCGLGQAR